MFCDYSFFKIKIAEVFVKYGKNIRHWEKVYRV